MAAKGQLLAQPVDHLHAQHVVAHTAHTGAGRACQARSHHTAHRRPARCIGSAKMGRLKRQVLLLFGQCSFQFGQWGTSTHRHHQFAGLITDDAGQGRGVQHLARQGIARCRVRTVKIFAAAPTNPQRRVVGNGGADPRKQVVKCGVSGVHTDDGSKPVKRPLSAR